MDIWVEITIALFGLLSVVAALNRRARKQVRTPIAHPRLKRPPSENIEESLEKMGIHSETHPDE